MLTRRQFAIGSAAIDVFVDELDLARLGFGGVEPEATGRPAYHPATVLKIYVYGYLAAIADATLGDNTIGEVLHVSA